MQPDGGLSYQAFEGGGAGATIDTYTSIICSTCNQPIYPPETPLTLELMKEIREAFGECSSMFECHTVEEMFANLNDITRDVPGEFKLHYWLDLNLSVEDGFGTPTEMINDMEARLNKLLISKGVATLQRRKYEVATCANPRCRSSVWLLHAVNGRGTGSVYCSCTCRDTTEGTL